MYDLASGTETLAWIRVPSGRVVTYCLATRPAGATASNQRPISCSRKSNTSALQRRAAPQGVKPPASSGAQLCPSCCTVRSNWEACTCEPNWEGGLRAAHARHPQRLTMLLLLSLLVIFALVLRRGGKVRLRQRPRWHEHDLAPLPLVVVLHAHLCRRTLSVGLWELLLTTLPPGCAANVGAHKTGCTRPVPATSVRLVLLLTPRDLSDGQTGRGASSSLLRSELAHTTRHQVHR